ncbi:MAG TPA: MFS transporter [Candidatus Angelobacter sp.]|nr:MFS transporter [Candidatus Angelobacter sp.]
MNPNLQINSQAKADPPLTDDPALPRADAVSGLAQGAVTDAAETTVIELPRIARALRNRDFRLFWAGNFLSNIGTWMQNVAQGWLVLKLTNSPFWLGVVGFASTIPILLFALIGGVIADHVNKRKLLIVTQSAMMVFAFAMAVLAYLNIITVRDVALLAAGTGIAMSLNTPSYQALVPRLIPREDLINAIALNSAQFNMSRVLGPTLGGFAMAAVGVAGNFFLNGLSFLAVIIALTQIHYKEEIAPGEGHFLLKLKQGFAYVFAREEMSSLVLLVSIASLLALPYLVFVPYFARDVLHSDERGLGILMACSGIGSFFAAGTIAYLGKVGRRGRFVVGAALGFFAAIIAFTFSRSFALSGGLLMLAGFFMIMMVATINALLQHLSDDYMRGRVMSIYSTAFLGLPPIGSLIAGSLARVVSAPHVIAGMVALAFVATIVVYGKRNALRELD